MSACQREKVEVVEVGLRDGLQILDRVLPTRDKIAWIDAEHACGVRQFEVASFVPPRLMPQMADAAEVVAPPGSCAIFRLSRSSRISKVQRRPLLRRSTPSSSPSRRAKRTALPT